jgi:hypothetical protein
MKKVSIHAVPLNDVFSHMAGLHSTECECGPDVVPLVPVDTSPDAFMEEEALAYLVRHIAMDKAAIKEWAVIMPKGVQAV